MSTALSSRPTMVRHLVVWLTTLVAVVLYLHRVCVSIAAEYIRADLGLDQKAMSWFLAIFFLSYALAQVPSGWLSDRYGARIMLAIYIVAWSLATAMIGAATSLVLLLGMRLACGLGQAGAYPTAGGLIKNWMPPSSRGVASGLVSAGGRLGGVMAPVLTAALMVRFVPVAQDVTFHAADILNGPQLCASLAPGDDAPTKPNVPAQPASLPEAVRAHLWDCLPADAQELVVRIAREHRANQALGLGDADLTHLTSTLNVLLDDPRLYDAKAFEGVDLPRDPLNLLQKRQRDQPLSPVELRRLNRFMLQGLFREDLAWLPVGGWRPVLMLYGAVGLLVAALFWLLVRTRPGEHPGVNVPERQWIAGEAAADTTPPSKPGMAPIVPILLSPSMWLNSLMQLATNIGWIFLITWLPRYLGSVHHLEDTWIGWVQMGVLLVGLIGMLIGGWVADALVPRVGLRWGRVLPMAVTRFTGAAAFGLCIVFTLQPSGSQLNSPWAFALALSIVAFSTDLGNPALWAYCQDVGGRHVGSILGWGNMIGNLGAFFGPLVYDAVLGEHPATKEWNTMFAVCAGAFVVSGLCALGIDATIPVGPQEE